MNIIVQIIGAFAIIMSILSYQNKRKIRFLTCQVLANILYATQYCLLGAFTGMATSSIAVVKSIIFYKCEKDKGEISFIWLLFFEIAIIVAGIILFDGKIISLMPIFITLMFTYGSWQKSLKLTCIIGAISATLWIIYNGIVGAYVACIGSIFELISGLIGLIRLIKNEKNSIQN
ncbi:MAG: YgjV family protein [Clostridia bacterium]|nr:YgjV family protein [Clostridia bacterium]